MRCQLVLRLACLCLGQLICHTLIALPKLVHSLIHLALLLQKPEYYEYMKSYSPVDNIKRADYPNIMVTAGLHDPRVGYW